MGAMDVVALRSICARHMDKQLLPMLQELQRAQEKIHERLEKLEIASHKSGMDRLAGENGQGGRHPDLAKQIRDMQVKLDLKANSQNVPSMDRFLELDALVRQGGSNTNSAISPAQIEILTAKISSKADAACVPTLQQFDSFVEKMETLSSAVHLKANIRDVPSISNLEDLQTLLQQKAPLKEVQKLAAAVERKANTSKVPTLAQVVELQNAVAGKIDANLVPTLAQVDELTAEVKSKASANSVASATQLQSLAAEVRRKADATDAVSPHQVEDLVKKQLAAAAAGKADLGDVPTMAQHKELAAVTERKLAFLASKVQQQRDHAAWDYCQPAVLCVPHVVEQQQQWEEDPWICATQGQQNRHTVH